MRRKFKLITTLASVAVTFIFLVMGIYAQVGLERRTDITGTVVFKAENVSADIFIYHSLYSDYANYVPYYIEYNHTRATNKNAATPDLVYSSTDSAQEDSNQIVTLNSNASTKLTMSDSKRAYTYHIIVKNTFPVGQSAILLDIEQSASSSNYDVFVDEEYSPDYVVYNKVTDEGKQKIYLAPQTEVILAVTIEAKKGISGQNFINAINSSISLTRYSGAVPAERATSALKYETAAGGYMVAGFLEGTNASSITEIFIPRKYNGQDVVAIKESAFTNNAYIKKIHFPNTLKIINHYSFRNTPLKNVNIPNAVTTIGGEAFYSNTSMTSFKIGSGVTYINWGAFYNTSIKELVIPSNLASLGSYVFTSTSKLVTIHNLSSSFSVINGFLMSNNNGHIHAYGGTSKDLTLPTGAIFLQLGLFRARILNSVEFPNTVTEISDSVFSASFIPNLTLPNSVTKLGSYSINGTALRELILPNSVTTLANYAIESNGRLERLVVSSGLTQIGTGAMSNNSSLKEVVFRGTGWLANYQAGFLNNASSSGLTIYVPTGTLATIQAAHASKSFSNRTITFVEMDMGLLFSYDSNLDGYVVNGFDINYSPAGMSASLFSVSSTLSTGVRDVFIPDTHSDGVNGVKPVVKIANNAFINDQTIRNVKLSANLKEIGQTAFGYSSVQQVYGSESLEIVGNTAFDSSGLKFIELPETVKTISGYAFSNTPNLKSIVLPQGLQTIGNGAFWSAGLTSITIPASVSTIESNAFRGSTLKQVVFEGYKFLPDNGGSLGTDLFVSQTNIEIIVPNGYAATFEANTSFATAINSNNIKIEKDYAALKYTYSNGAYTVTGLADGETGKVIVIPTHYNNGTNGAAPVTTIAAEAFRNAGLTSVVLPETITRIETNAFNSNLLKTINLPKNLTYIGRAAFYSNHLEAVVIPSATTTVGDSAFSNNYNSSQAKITLKNVIVESGNPNYKTENNYLLNKAGDTIVLYFGNDSHITIPNTITKIGTYAFVNNKQLVSVGIPNSVTQISGGAFEGTSLQTIHIPASVKTLSQWSFGGISTLRDVVIEGNAFFAANGGSSGRFLQSSGLNKHIKVYTYSSMLSSMQALHASANTTLRFFDNADRTIEWGTITEGITYTYLSDLDGYRVDGFTGSIANPKNFDNPTTLILPTYHNGANGIKPIVDIKADSFRTDNIIKSPMQYLVLPSLIKRISRWAFGYNSSMLNNPRYVAFAFPSTLEKLESLAFYSTGFTGNWYLPKGLTEIGTGGIRGNAKSFIIEVGNPNFVVTNGMLIDNLRNKLIETITVAAGLGTNVIIPSGVQTLGGYSFMSRGISSVTIPSTVTVIEQYVFSGNNLTSLTLPSGLTSIGANAFQNNKLAGTLTLPSSLITLSSNAFAINNFTSVVFPSTLKTLQPAFASNADLQSVVFLGSGIIESGGVYSLDSFTTAQNNALTIYVPTGKLTAFQTADATKRFASTTITVTFVQGAP